MPERNNVPYNQTKRLDLSTYEVELLCEILGDKLTELESRPNTMRVDYVMEKRAITRILAELTGEVNV